jgi:enolase
VRILGDDLLCTRVERIHRAADARAADALLLKVNQVGTLTEAAEALRAARAAGWSVTVSARSGETEDDWLADLAVGWGADHIKVGSITQSERLAKYNRLLAIERETGLPLA